MLFVRWTQAVRYSQPVARFGFLSSFYALVFRRMLLHVTYSFLFLCTAATPVLYAQCPAALAASSTLPNSCKDVKCPIVVPTNGNKDDDSAVAQLRKEWDDPNQILNTFRAFQLLATSPQADRLNCKVLSELKGDNPHKNPKSEFFCQEAKKDSAHPIRQGTYAAAFGGPGPDGQPTFHVDTEFIDALAKANSLGQKGYLAEDGLLGCTKDLVQVIREAPVVVPLARVEVTKNSPPAENISGPEALGVIHDLFTAQENYVALYRLLDAYPKPPGLVDSQPAQVILTQDYVHALEFLRAAFEMDIKALADEITPATKTAKQ
jgi:hypothetical protein